MAKTYNKSIISLIVSFAMFMEALDTTIINTSIPVMSHSLNVNPIDLKIALISYLLSLAIFIPISGWIADKFGIKRVFIFAILVFTLSSIWCGFSRHLSELVLARSLQGFGGSLTIPVGRLLLLRTFPKHELIPTMNRVIMLAALGMMLGPLLGGFIVYHFSWPWIFWVNVPVGLITIVAAWFVIVDVPPQKVHLLDKIGFILFGTSLALFTFGLSALSETYVSDEVAILIIFFAILLFISYIIHSHKRQHPIVKSSLFRAVSFRVSILGNLVSRVGFGGVPFLLPLLLQISLGYSAQMSGLLIAPMAAGVLLIKFFTLPILRFFGYKRLLILNTSWVALSLWTFMLIDSKTSVYFISILTFIFGFLISLQYSSMNSLAYAEVDQGDLSAASSIMSTMQQLSQSFGVAIGALCIRWFSPGDSGDTFLLTTAVFHHAFFALGLLTFFSILVFMKLQTNDGYQMLRSEKTLQSKM